MNIFIIFIVLVNFLLSSDSSHKLEFIVTDLVLRGEYEMLSENYQNANKYYLEALQYEPNSIAINLSLFAKFLISSS